MSDEEIGPGALQAICNAGATVVGVSMSCQTGALDGVCEHLGKLRKLKCTGPVDLAALALAAWCEYLRLGDDPENPLQLSPDPALDSAVELAKQSAGDPTAFLAFDTVFSPALRTGRFAAAFERALREIRTDGVPSAVGTALG